MLSSAEELVVDLYHRLGKSFHATLPKSVTHVDELLDKIVVDIELILVDDQLLIHVGQLLDKLEVLVLQLTNFVLGLVH